MEPELEIVAVQLLLLLLLKTRPLSISKYMVRM